MCQSPVLCHLFLALPCLLSELCQLGLWSMLKPLEAMQKKTFGDMTNEFFFCLKIYDKTFQPSSMGCYQLKSLVVFTSKTGGGSG